jgi:site-specific DNA recombinase
VVTNAVRSPVRPATLWMRVVSMALARVIAGRMVVSRRASIDFPVPGGPKSERLWTEHPHDVLHRLATVKQWRSPFGYKAKKFMDGPNEKTRLEPDETFTPLIQRIFQMCADGMGAKEIVKTLNSEGLRTNKGKLWNKNNVYYVLKNEVYTGTLVWNRQHKSQGRPKPKDPKDIIRIENNHPAVIGHEMFEKVQALLRERSPEITHPRTVNSDYLLSGFLYCGKCGSGMLGCAAKSSRFFYYACHNYCKRGKDVCNARLIKKERIEGFVIDRITERCILSLIFPVC